MVTVSNDVDQAVRATSPITVQRSLMRCVTLRFAEAGSSTVALPEVFTYWPGFAAANTTAAFGGTSNLALPPVILCSTLER
ncbi:hypothetical protein D3C71_918920 [compost metagenome]